jgi:predicted RNA binding protein YcfA (HicA-like mRNA interferase family)
MKTVSGKEFVKLLQAKGWELQRIRGSHHILRHADFRDSVSVPVHGNTDLKIGLLKQLLKQTGISEDEL